MITPTILIGALIALRKYPSKNRNKVYIDFKRAREKETKNKVFSYNFSMMNIVDMLSATKIIIDNYYSQKKLIGDYQRKTYLDANGYWRFKDSNILVHRYVARKYLGRRLKFGEVVHHQDGNKWNNRPYNLHVCTQAEHEGIHMHNLKTYGNWYGN